MLQGMRKATRGAVAGVFVALLLAAFAMWGVNDVFRSVNEPVVARGDGVEVTVPEFERELERRLARARQAGQTATREDVARAGLHKALRDEMVAERALDRVAKRLGVQVTDGLVAEEIRKIPDFKNQITGGFDKDAYQRLLSDNGFSTAEFEEGLRRDIARRQVIGALVAGVAPPRSFQDFLITFETERRSVDIAQIPLERVGQPPQPNDQQVEEHYQSLKARFATPEYRALTLVTADQADFVAKAEVSEEDLRRIYELRKQALATPETRSFVQVSAPNEAAAQEAAVRLAAGDDAEAVAAAIGGSAAPFEGVARDKAADPKIAAAVFAVAEGQSTPAIEGALTWAAARVTAVTPAKERSFDEVRQELALESAAEEAEALTSAAVEQFEDLLAEGQSPADAAAKAGLRLRAIEAADAQGRGRDGAPIQGLAGEADLLKAAFAATEGEASDFLALKSGAYGRVAVDRVVPPGVRPLAEVRDSVVQSWRNQWLRDGFTKVVDEIKAKVAAGETFPAAVAAARAALREEGAVVDRRIAQEGPQAAVGRSIFTAREGEIVTAAPPGPPSLLVIKVNKIIRQEAKDAPPQLRAQVSEALTQRLTQDLLMAAQTGAVKAAKIKPGGDQVLDQLFNVGEAAAAP